MAARPPGEKGEFERIWHAIDVEFPVGKEVVIERRYRVSNGSSVAAAPEIFFEYSTATGGVWNGTIGEMIADVTLEGGLTVDGLLWNSAPGTGVSPAREHWRISIADEDAIGLEGFRAADGAQSSRLPHRSPAIRIR